MTEMNASESTNSTSFHFHYSTYFREKQDIDCIVYPAEIDLERGRYIPKWSRVVEK